MQMSTGLNVVWSNSTFDYCDQVRAFLLCDNLYNHTLDGGNIKLYLKSFSDGQLTLSSYRAVSGSSSP